eukprot:scaffold4160_cov130-Isochrysis_galbana.AAC.3
MQRKKETKTVSQNAGGQVHARGGGQTSDIIALLDVRNLPNLSSDIGAHGHAACVSADGRSMGHVVAAIEIDSWLVDGFGQMSLSSGWRHSEWVSAHAHFTDGVPPTPVLCVRNSPIPTRPAIPTACPLP